MPRPVWLDAAPDVEAVARLLEEAAGAAGSLHFTPREVPPGTDSRILHQAALARARRQLAASHSEADRILSQEVRAVDDLVRSANLLVERLREWYALHAPEATRLVADSEALARLVARHGERGAVLGELNEARAAATSLGTDLAPADLAVVQGFAAALAAVHDSWHALEARIQALMQEVAPNLASVTGPTIGARLIAQAGGLERLATWPAGTVQLLGAETALFRHLKEGTPPPKHGILFQHALVHQAAPNRRGPAARALALAASTAAKADAFTKNDLREHLKRQLDDDLRRIQARPAIRPATQGPAGRKPGGWAPRAPRPGPPALRPGAPPGPPQPGPPAPAGRPGGAPRPPARQPGRAVDTRPWKKAPAGPGEGARSAGPGGGPASRGSWQGPRDGPSPGRQPGQPPRRKQGAFRGSKGPAKPPGRGDR